MAAQPTCNDSHDRFNHVVVGMVRISFYKKKSAVIWCKVAKPCKTLAALGNEFEQVFGKLSAFDDGAASFNYIDIRCTVSIFLLVFTACLACVHVYGCF